VSLRIDFVVFRQSGFVTSLAVLSDWYVDLILRIEQLQKWQETLIMPNSIWLGGFFNPMAFVTAVMQVTARKKLWALDNVTISTAVMTFNPEGADKQPEDGAYVHGM
jgi:dynein heavy chain